MFAPIGFGTIAGASIFNLLGNAGVAAVLAGQELPITPGVRAALWLAQNACS